MFVFVGLILLTSCKKDEETPLPMKVETCEINCFTGFNEVVDYGTKAAPMFPDGGVYWSAYQYETDGTLLSKGGEKITTPEFEVVFEVGKEALINVYGSYNSHDAITALSDFMGQSLSGVSLYTGGFVSETPMGDLDIQVPCSIYNGITGVKYDLPVKVTAEDGTVYDNLNLKSFWKVAPKVKTYSSAEAIQDKAIGSYVELDNLSEQLTNIVDPASTYGCVYSLASEGTIGFKVYNGTTYLQDLQNTVTVEEAVCKLVSLKVNAKLQNTTGAIVFDAEVTIVEQNINEDI